ncbi:Fe-S cluster assembly sulfur transfer protein SufU [Roseivirga sp. UBA1976]|uniref:Fe-S cluster assembly sulfur transfer protein SufU n=1 Tax=Roseivirga sp. UBA1976 TaxID=1947386 RepID=UPI00257B3DEE|nr:SUF system NifU family Fe-S cluster assembly protein [Roseivirga sp. UBA1976]|tara:strand:- start:5390 stop:5827 length:438 start_codon:yes stop_codon:yes gene_type:complete
MNKALQSLYKEVILSRAKVPRYECKAPDLVPTIEAYNPLCGDKFYLYVSIEDRVFKELKFSGFGCSISKASTDVMCDALSHKTIQEGLLIIDTFLELIDDKSSVSPEQLTDSKELLAFAAARDFPERKTCANLGWEALRLHLQRL